MKQIFKLFRPATSLSRDELHELYLKRVSSSVHTEQQDGFRQLMEALKPCKNETVHLTEVMSQANFETLLKNVPQYLAIAIPSHSDNLQADTGKSPTSFEDCMILYLVTKACMSQQHQIDFCYNMSQLLAKKGYYYQDIAIKNTGYPIDALDYALLVFPYHGPNLSSFYRGGIEQIAVEYHYSSGMATLQWSRHVLQNCSKEDITDSDVQAFFKHFTRLVPVVKMCAQYRNATAMVAFKKECASYFSSSALLHIFEKTFRFRLRHYATDAQLLKKEFPSLLELMNSWSSCDVSSAIKGIRLFNIYLAEKKQSLSKNVFYVSATEETDKLLLQLETGQPSSYLNPKALPDITYLIKDIHKRFTQMLTIGKDVNKHSVAELQKKITEEATSIVKSLLSSIEDTLGTAPCAFSILGLGSYSREEMSLCSDIDFAILVSDESCVRDSYFKYLFSMLVHVRRGLPANVLTIESKDLQTLFSQENSLIHTPEEMVSEHCPLYQTAAEINSLQERIINPESYSVRRARLIFNSRTQSQESKVLYENYQNGLKRRLQTVNAASSTPYYQTVGELCFAEDFKKCDGKKLMDTTEINAIPLKQTHLKPLMLWVSDVGIYYGIEDNNTWAILRKLKQALRIAPVFLQELEEALTYLHTLRLKLHHAWLTQPKPAELPFDMWLEMPNDNTTVTTCDFYLDPVQRSTLDAIQRRIIEPLAATISVFGATPPALQFDPLTYYFEQQFKNLNKKHIEEAKRLSTLAEIALRRPSLLMPNSTFRGFSPELKIAYLDVLEVALHEIKQANDLKEIEELKILVQALWHYPTEDGWRAESFRLERRWNQQLMRLVSSESLCSISYTLSLVKDNTLKYYTLKPHIVSQLFTKQGDWKPKDEQIRGNHLVYKITEETGTEILSWAKVYPEQPGIEWLMLHLDQRLGVYGIPCSTLANIYHNGQKSAVLLSAHVPHPNLLHTLQSSPKKLINLDHAHFFKTLMRVLLTNPEDDKGDDYFLESHKNGLKLIRIDNERAFFAAESVEGALKVRKLQVKSILYCLDLLIEPMQRGKSCVDIAIQDFLRLKPYALLKNLLWELEALQPLWQILFSEEDIEAHYQNKKPWLSLPILYVPQELVKELSVRMESLQTLLVLTPKTTGLELLRTVQPTLAQHYLQGFDKYRNSQKPYSEVLARFNLSPGQHYKKQGHDLVSLHGTEAVTQSLRLTTILTLEIVKSIWKGKSYAANAVLREIEHWEADCSKEVYNGLLHPNHATRKIAQAKWQQLPNRQRVLLFNDFSTWARKNPFVDIHLQQAILCILPEITFHKLDLSAFYLSLNDKLLTLILKTGGDHLVELTLNGCLKLSEAIPSIIADNCPNLKILNVSNMGWKSFSSGLTGRLPIVFPKVTILEMQNCQNLKRFIVHTPQADVNLQGCVALKRIQFSLYSFVTSAKHPGECQYQLAKSYLLGTDVLKNLVQAYYWAKISLEYKHLLAQALCGECEYAMAKSYLLGEGVVQDIKQAYYWAQLSQKNKNSFSSILCYTLFSFYHVIPANGIDEHLAVEQATISLVGKALFTSIQFLKNPSVTTLRLNNIYAPAHYILINLILSGNNTLKHLDLENNTLGVVGAISLFEALKLNKTLQSLNLQGNNIGSEGAIALAEVLKQNNVLQGINLEHNNIDATGASALAKALKTNSTLQNLALYNNVCAAENEKIIMRINGCLAKNQQCQLLLTQNALPNTPEPLVMHYKEHVINARRPSINNTYPYEDNDIQAILFARLRQLQAQHSELFTKPIEILSIVDNLMNIQLENGLREAARKHQGSRICLIPCNVGNAHWVGMLLEFGTDEAVLRAEYIPSCIIHPHIPEAFQVQLQKVYPKARFQTRVLLQQNELTSCDVYTIENLLTAALGIQPPAERATIRPLHLESLRQYYPTFYNDFNERQRNNYPTIAKLHEQLGLLNGLKNVWFSKQELNRILAIKQCLFNLPDETQIALLEAFKYHPTYKESTSHLDTIRIALQETVLFDSKSLSELIQLLFEMPTQSGTALSLETIKFRVSYNEILAVTQCKVILGQINELQKTLAEQIMQDEEFARKLQAELWSSEILSLLARECQPTTPRRRETFV